MQGKELLLYRQKNQRALRPNKNVSLSLQIYEKFQIERKWKPADRGVCEEGNGSRKHLC